MPLTYTDMVNRWSGLSTERSSFIEQWMELSSYILPSNGRFFLQDRDKGYKKFNSIYDNTGTRALRTLGAGLMAGATSPARPWFRLQTPDDDLNGYQPVKVWLDQVSALMHKVFQKSNTYRALHQIYEEMGTFGTGCSIILPDFDNVICHYPLSTGEYCLAQDAKGNVCTMYRQFQMQVSAIVKEYGIDNCSQAVQNLYRNNGLDQWITLQHSIEPRQDRDSSKKDAKNMAWASITMEVGINDGKFLRESGFKRFPVVAPRWAVAGGDIYGTSPGMEALGDIKQLQHEQKRKGMGIDYQTNPPLAVPTTLKNKDIDRLPGGVTYIDQTQQNLAVRNLVEVDFNLNYLMQDIQDVRGRIERTFFSDLFLMISNQTDPRMTATEVAARQEEKMLMLGPVLERLSNELLYPMVEITFDAMMDAGILPPPPQELQGQELGVELQSVLAQAQQAIGTNSIDRFLSTIGGVAQFKPEVLDKIDPDKLVDVYADKLGVDPSIINSNDTVQAVREARAKAQAAQAQTAMQEQQSKTAKNLGATPTAGGGTAYDQLNEASGYTASGGYLQ